jgi:hypothetical protein
VPELELTKTFPPSASIRDANDSTPMDVWTSLDDKMSEILEPEKLQSARSCFDGFVVDIHLPHPYNQRLSVLLPAGQEVPAL